MAQNLIVHLALLPVQTLLDEETVDENDIPKLENARCAVDQQETEPILVDSVVVCLFICLQTCIHEVEHGLGNEEDGVNEHIRKVYAHQWSVWIREINGLDEFSEQTNRDDEDDVLEYEEDA